MSWGMKCTKFSGILRYRLLNFRQKTKPDLVIMKRRERERENWLNSGFCHPSRPQGDNKKKVKRDKYLNLIKKKKKKKKKKKTQKL